MEIEEFKNTFKAYCDLKITDQQYQEFYYYMKALLEWNKKINITAITDEKEFIIKHFVDSLSINKYLNNYNSIIDIGTGAGFPGVPIKIINKSKKITLIDSIGKKLKVIEDINKNLRLNNLEIIHTRAEELAHINNYREKFDVSVTRAVSNMSTICEFMLPFVKIGGIAICMKGPNFEKELSNSKKAIELLGGKIEFIDKLTYSNEINRSNIIIKKVKNTPGKYPRGQGKPLKEPII